MTLQLKYLPCLLLLCLVPTACTTPGIAKPEGDYDTLLQDADAAIRRGEARVAIRLTSRAVALKPNDYRAYRSRGDVFFLLGNYTKAAKDYKRVLSLGPEHALTRQHWWSARLMASPGQATRKQILREISDYHKQAGSDPIKLITVYSGYAALWDRTNGQQIVLQIMKLPIPEHLRATVSEMLLDEMIQARNRKLARRMSRLWIDQLPDNVNTPLAIAVWFRNAEHTKETARQIDRWLHNHPDNPWLVFHVAQHYLVDNSHRTQGLELLSRVDDLLDRPAYRCHKPGVRKTCDYYRSRLRGQAAGLLAQWYVKQGKLSQAAHILNRALERLPWEGRLWAELSRIQQSQGKNKEARQSLLAALRLNPALKQDEKRLPQLSHGTPVREIRKAIAQDQDIPVFTDVTHETGLSRISGMRVAWGDVDNDGYDDLLVDGHILLHNNNGSNFSDISSPSGLRPNKHDAGGLFADIDNDGMLDLLVFGKDSTRLYRNTSGTFSLEKNFIKQLKTPHRIEAAAFGDGNNDGFPDLYLANYEKPATRRALCYPDQYLVNRQGKSFLDATASSLLEHDIPTCGRGVIWTDLDNDGRQDLFVSNYRLNPNLYWKNMGSTFADQALNLGIQGTDHHGSFGHSISSVSADFNHDGRLDLFTTNLTHPRYYDSMDQSTLFLQREKNRRAGFVPTRQEIQYTDTSADAAVADVDNDGDLDLYVSAIYPKAEGRLYLNDGSGQLTDVTWASGTLTTNSWGVAFGDYDNDGDSDLVVAGKSGVRLFRNDTHRFKSLTVSIKDPVCQRQGIGARIRVSTGNRSQLREIHAGKGTGTQDSYKLLFGLGTHTGPVTVEARTTCGQHYRWQGRPPDNYLLVIPASPDT